LERRTVVLEHSLFIILALFIVGGGVVTITNRQPLFSAFGFLVGMLAMAGIFGLLENQFLALAQIMVSVGAVVVLNILTIMTVNAKEENLPPEPHKYRWIFLSAVLVSPVTFLIYKSMSMTYQHFSSLETVSTQVMGATLFSAWVLPFEIVSILLLTAMVGAIVIARKKDVMAKER